MNLQMPFVMQMYDNQICYHIFVNPIYILEQIKYASLQYSHPWQSNKQKASIHHSDIVLIKN